MTATPTPPEKPQNIASLLRELNQMLAPLYAEIHAEIQRERIAPSRAA
jgi:hypothetical protein